MELDSLLPGAKRRDLAWGPLPGGYKSCPMAHFVPASKSGGLSFQTEISPQSPWQAEVRKRKMAHINRHSNSFPKAVINHRRAKFTLLL